MPRHESDRRSIEPICISSPEKAVDLYSINATEKSQVPHGRKLPRFAGAFLLTISAPQIVQETLETISVKVAVPGAEDRASANHDCALWNPDGTCAEYVPHEEPVPTPTQPPANTQPPSGGVPKPPSAPKPTPTTTVAWEYRDDDNDGAVNGIDACLDTNAGQEVDANGCSADQRDDDGDGLNGALEKFFGTDQNNSDTDGDGISDGAEILNPDGSIKDVLDVDTDDIIDALESNSDTDGDGLSPATGDSDDTNPCLPASEASVCDGDVDGLTNEEELNKGTDPNSQDSDRDGVLDDVDVQNQELDLGETVDANGVVIPATTQATSTTELVANNKPSATDDLESSTTGGESSTTAGSLTTDNQEVISPALESDNSPDGGSLAPYLVVLGGILLAGGGIVGARRGKDRGESGKSGSAKPTRAKKPRKAKPTQRPQIATHRSR